jgi:hypothetical protein
MGTIIGVVVGYALGSREGPGSWDEVKKAWKTIVTSGEVRDLVIGGVSVLRPALGRVLAVLAGAGGQGEQGRGLRRVA